MARVWIVHWLGALSLGFAMTAPMDAVERDAKYYLRACVNSVLIARMNLPHGPVPLEWQKKSCADPVFDLAHTQNRLRMPDVRDSRIEVAARWPEGFRVIVTDQSGRVWSGGPSNLPVLPPRTPLFPGQQPAKDILAQQFLRRCVQLLSEKAVAGELSLDWERKPCPEALLSPADLTPSWPDSSIHLRPDTQEGFEVTVSAATGRTFRWPEQGTPVPPPDLRDKPVSPLGAWVVAMLALAATLAFLTIMPGSRGPAVAGLVLGALGVPLLWSAWRNWIPEWPAFIVLAGLLVWLGAGVLGSLPRMVYRARLERWWEALGNAVLWSLVLLPIMLSVWVGVTSAVFEVPWRSFWRATVILLGSVIVAGYSLRRRLTARPP